MNLKKLIEIVSKKTEIDENKIGKILSEVKATIFDVLNKGGEINIKGFGKFVSKQTKERVVLNPITKRYIYCESKKKVVFKFFKNFKYCIK